MVGSINLTIAIEWNALYPTLMERLEEAKVVYQKRRHRNKILRRFKVMQEQIDRICGDGNSVLGDDERPFAEDISVLEPFRSMIFQDTDEDPKCLSMDDSTFRQVMVDWHHERKQFILSLLPADLIKDVDDNEVRDPLHLEAVYFCGGGDDTVQYYYHTLCRSRQTSGEIPSDAPKEFSLLYKGEFRRPWQWDRDRWSFDFERYTVTTTMLVFLGMDPRTTTPISFLIDCDVVRLHCIQCDSSEILLHNCWSAVCVLTLMPMAQFDSFRCQMKHELDHHRDNIMFPGELKWRVVS